MRHRICDIGEWVIAPRTGRFGQVVQHAYGEVPIVDPRTGEPKRSMHGTRERPVILMQPHGKRFLLAYEVEQLGPVDGLL